MEIQDAAQAKQVFDDISYGKGCAILMMLFIDLGPDKFLKGIKLYLRRYAYDTTTSEDLWASLEEATAEPIRERMLTWTKKPGYPVVTVTEVIDKESQRVVALHILQNRFLSSPDRDVVGKASDDVYDLRLGIRIDSGIRMVRFNTKEMTIDISETSFIKVNADHTSFCRISYSTSHLKKLIKAAAGNKLTLRDSIGLSRDIEALVAAGINRTSDLLDLSLGLMPRKEYLVWEIIHRNVQAVGSAFKFHDASITNGLRKAVTDIVGPKSHELG